MITSIVVQPDTNFTPCNEPPAVPLQRAAATAVDATHLVPAPLEAHLARLVRKGVESECVGDNGSGKWHDAVTALRRPLRTIVVVEAG
jgi:hypothetical protein